MNDDLKNLSASVHARLANIAKDRGQPFQEVLLHYGIERFLYRLSRSKYCQEFVLKGGLIIEVQRLPNRRFTRDIDLRGFIESSIEETERIIKEICSQDVEADGVFFDPSTIQLERIREHSAYPGIRVRFLGLLGNSRIYMQIDIGFADDIFPGTENIQYPTLLGMDQPILRGYRSETIIAEKFHAMTYLGDANSRMKDFFDIWLFSKHYSYDGTTLQQSILRTFKRRKTPLPKNPPPTFQVEFAETHQRMWEIFVNKIQGDSIPYDFLSVISDIASFLIPICEALAEEKDFYLKWNPEKGWR